MHSNCQHRHVLVWVTPLDPHGSPLRGASMNPTFQKTWAIGAARSEPA